MKYDIVNGTDMELFVDRVNKKIEAGWIPKGGIVFARRQNAKQKSYFIQAIIKE